MPTLGELSMTLAHAMNQPLAIILSNAQAAQRLLAKPQPDQPEVEKRGVQSVEELVRRVGWISRGPGTGLN